MYITPKSPAFDKLSTRAKRSVNQNGKVFPILPFSFWLTERLGKGIPFPWEKESLSHDSDSNCGDDCESALGAVNEAIDRRDEVNETIDRSDR